MSRLRRTAPGGVPITRLKSTREGRLGAVAESVGELPDARSLLPERVEREVHPPAGEIRHGRLADELGETAANAERDIATSPAMSRRMLCIDSRSSDPPARRWMTSGRLATRFCAAGWSKRTAPQMRFDGSPPPPWRRTS